jgi:acyl-CoA thioester hydrolase
VDRLGHVNNVVWVRFVVELAFAHSEAVGWDAEAYTALGAWWIVHRHEVEYHAPAFPGDALVEETWVREMRAARCRRESRFTRVADGTLLVTASTVWAFADAARGRPRRVPADLARAFPRVDAPARPPRRAPAG